MSNWASVPSGDLFFLKYSQPDFFYCPFNGFSDFIQNVNRRFFWTDVFLNQSIESRIGRFLEWYQMIFSLPCKTVMYSIDYSCKPDYFSSIFFGELVSWVRNKPKDFNPLIRSLFIASNRQASNTYWVSRIPYKYSVNITDEWWRQTHTTPCGIAVDPKER